MKKIGATIIIAFVSGVLFFYFINNLTVWNQSKIEEYIERFDIKTNEDFRDFIQESEEAGIIFDYLNLRNVIIVHLIGLIAAISSLALVHMIVDKLFFKKFFEEPNVYTAVRRASWIPILIFIFNIIRIVGGLNVYYLVFVLIIGIIFAFIEFGYSTKPKNSQNENQIKTVKNSS